MKQTYHINIAGLERDLQLFPISDTLCIGAFIMFGDVEITKTCARELLRLAPPHDIMITAETKGIPLLYEMARQENAPNYVIARKAPKLYMEDILTTRVHSITTADQQTLCIGSCEIKAMKGKRVLIVDDVVSTGESLAAIETLVNQAGGHIAGKMAVLAEGKASQRTDLIYLQKLPLFRLDGTAIENE